MAMRPRNAIYPNLPVYADAMPSTSRVMRRPQHRFQLETRPFQIVPFLLAPVLPGESLETLLMQSRVVTDPIKNPLIGWWKEYYVFYVRHRDMPGSAVLQSMMLDPSDVATSLKAGATSTDTYTYQGAVDWVGQCLDPVVKEYFRRPSEVSSGTWDDAAAKLGNYFLAQINLDSWMDSLVDDTVLFDGDPLPDDVDAATLGEVDRLRVHFEAMRDAQLIDMDYDDWLRTYGVNIPKAETPGRPELVRYSKNWQYPSNTVDPTTGIPASAVSWAIAERADKKRFFKEPGFLFGVTVTRPKVYYSKQVGHAAGMMDNAFSWLPAVLQEEAAISLKQFAADTGPLFGNTTNGYWVDVRDLLVYGDQFVNFALTETDQGLVALPTVALQKDYVASADVDALFKSASPANKIREDGVVNLGIAGRQRDMT